MSSAYSASIESTTGSDTPKRRRHVAADAQILGVELDAEAGRIAAADHVRRAMHEIPARAGAGAERGHHAIERQLVRARERHGFGAGADDAGAHDLVGGLGGLAGTRGTEMFDGFAHRGEDRARGFESGGVTARHDGERAFLRTFDTAADRSIDELRRVRKKFFRPACGFSAHRGAVDDQRALAQTRRQAFDDGADVRIRGYADDHRIDAARRTRPVNCGRLAAKLRGERERFIATAVPDGFEQSGTMEIFRHGSTHGTETRKANALHRRELSGASATKENAVQRTAFIEHVDGTQALSALGAADGFDGLGGIHALLREFGFGQVFTLAVLAGAIHALRIDGGLVGLARLLATLGA